MRRFLNTILATLVLIPNLVLGQYDGKGFKKDKKLTDLTMDHWTGREGLISNNLTSVNQASSHFIWITSFNGILRFDGIEFKLYDKNKLPFLNSNAFYKSF